MDAADPDGSADVVVDHDDPDRPAIIREAPDLTSVQPHIRRTRAFFGARARAWDERFPDDDAAYAEAIAELDPRRGGVAVDLGCGTGRALAHLHRAAGVGGTAVGIDVTEPMVRVAAAKNVALAGGLVLGDVMHLPLADRSVDAFFGAGLVTHVPDARSLLRELARAARPGCRLALFHPVGRAALARRHQRELRSDELLDPSVLPEVLADCGWRVARIEDAEHRYFALAGLAA
jgi:SAM-dependent methyltransferase